MRISAKRGKKFTYIFRVDSSQMVADGWRPHCISCLINQLASRISRTCLLHERPECRQPRKLYSWSCLRSSNFSRRTLSAISRTLIKASSSVLVSSFVAEELSNCKSRLKTAIDVELTHEKRYFFKLFSNDPCSGWQLKVRLNLSGNLRSFKADKQ